MNNLTQKRLRELLHYDPLTGFFYRRFSGVRWKAGDVAGTINSHRGYVELWLEGTLYAAHRLVIFYMEGYWPEGQVDHEDQVKHHNWYSNLRPDTSPYVSITKYWAKVGQHIRSQGSLCES